MAVTFIVLAVLFARRYPVRFPSGSDYYADIARLEAAMPGDTVTIHFPPDWKCELRNK